MPPNWLIAAVLALVAIWKVKKALRYKSQSSLFIKEIAGNKWIDKSQLQDAIQYYIYIETYFYISLPIFAAISYVRALVPYLWPIGISLLMIYGIAFVWWDRKFSIKKRPM